MLWDWTFKTFKTSGHWGYLIKRPSGRQGVKKICSFPHNVLMNFVYYYFSLGLWIGDAEFCINLKVTRTVYSSSSLTLALCSYTVSAQLRPVVITLVVVVTKHTSVASVTAPTPPSLLFCVYVKKNLCAIWCNSMQIYVRLIDRSVSLCLIIIIPFFMLKHIKNCRSQGPRNVSLTSSRMVLTASELINTISPRCNKVCRGLYKSSWFWFLFVE
jgi:hypothetical protein